MKLLNIFILFFLFMMASSSNLCNKNELLHLEEVNEQDSLVYYKGGNVVKVALQKNFSVVGCYQLISAGIDTAFSVVSGKNEMAILMKNDTLVILRDWMFFKNGYKTTVPALVKKFPMYHVEANDYDTPYYFLMHNQLDSLCFDYNEEDSIKSVTLSNAIIRDTVFSYGPAKIGMNRQHLGKELGIDLDEYPSARVIILPHYYKFTLKKHPLKRTYAMWTLPSVSLYSIVVNDSVEQIFINEECNHIKPSFGEVHL